ncbi:MAG: chromosomal replication initiator protein DnaA [Ruminococcaceae bacterium]|nr:chromosomal replication initiator protein DnaA [Oscillospiraceae bacterium]
MNSLQDIWNSVMENMAQTLTPTAMNTWFADCKPVEFSESRMVIHTNTDFKRNIIASRYADNIRQILYDIFSAPIELIILSGEELDNYREQQKGNDPFGELVADFTFDNFVVGSSNKFAHAAAMAVSRNPGNIYNPLFIYGNSGLGKTHLLLAIGQYIHETMPEKNIVYTKSEEFTTELIRSIREGSTEDFRQRYRSADLLLMDDIQFISGKNSTQEEFFHTFNTLYLAGKQIVVTSDRPPMEMRTLEDRIRTRLEGGLMADVQSPDLETRMAITRNKASLLGMHLPDNVVEYIAENITSNIRQLEGVVKRLTAYKEILNDNISVDSVKRAIKDVIHIGNYVPTPDIITGETARFLGLDEESIRGQSRAKDIALARQIAMYLCRNLTNLSLADIGRHFSDRNHATVLSSIKKVEDMVRTRPDMAATIRDITSNINSKN